MEEMMLERFFDEFIANQEPPRTEETEAERQFFLLLPDELLDIGDQKESLTLRQTISTSLQHGSESQVEVEVKVEEQKEEEPPPIVTTTQNVMARCEVGCRLDLKFIASHTWNVVYNTNTYLGLIIRLRKPKITANIYSSGKIVFTGAQSEEKSRCGARRCVRKLQKIGFPVHFKNFKICSVMANCRMFPLHLVELQRSNPMQCSYEPELFMGLHYKVKPGLTLTIHHTGTVSIAGAKSAEEAEQVFESFRTILWPFRKLKNSEF